MFGNNSSVLISAPSVRQKTDNRVKFLDSEFLFVQFFQLFTCICTLLQSLNI